jgi:hypothetical protein
MWSGYSLASGRPRDTLRKLPRPRRFETVEPVNAVQSSAEALADAKFAIQESGNWIKNADTKSTLIAAAVGVVATASASKADVVYRAFSGGKLGCASLLLLALIVAYVVTLLVTAYCLYRALSPRTDHLVDLNRFAWPSVVARGPSLPELSWAKVNEEAWAQNYMLACIARDKYRAFKSALTWFGLNLAAAVLMIFAATWASTGVSLHGTSQSIGSL